MKIAILGYGKMGKAIEQVALERNHEPALKIDSSNLGEMNAENLKACDVAIEFSRPETAVQNIEACLSATLPVVVGTTGWYEEYERLAEMSRESGAALLKASNFSVGVNLFFELNRQLTKIMSSHEDYQVEMKEIHHLQKLDSPSGTAITLAEDIIALHPAYDQWENRKSQTAKSLGILSERKADVKGTHIVNYSSPIDNIEISHQAKSRKGFALGAVLAAEFIKDKQGVFQMRDVLNI